MKSINLSNGETPGILYISSSILGRKFFKIVMSLYINIFDLLPLILCFVVLFLL